MKGIVFTEFLEMVEDEMSPDLVDRIIEASDLASEGAYTSIGTYEFSELAQLVTQLSKETGIPVPELIRAFGKHLFGRFFKLYPVFFEGVESSFEFMDSVHRYVHIEVQKLYADAELPSFECDSSDPGTLIMEYRSSRPLGDLAEGLIEGCILHFGEDIQLQRENLATEPQTHVRFTLTRQG